MRTHSIRRAHENIDKTIKSAEVILQQFDLSRQVSFPFLVHNFVAMSLLIVQVALDFAVVG